MKFCHVSDLKTLLAALVYHFAGALPRAHKKTINRISMKKQAKVPFQVLFSDFWVFSSTSGPFPGKFAKLSGIIAPPQKGVWGPHAHFDHICTPVFSLSRKAERRAGSSHQARGLLHYYQVPHNMAQCKKKRWQMTKFDCFGMDWRLLSIDGK